MKLTLIASIMLIISSNLLYAQKPASVKTQPNENSIFKELGIVSPINPDLKKRDSLRLKKSIINGYKNAIDSVRELKIREVELDILLRYSNTDKESYVTPKNHSNLIAKEFRGVSGTEIKNGKYFGQSVSVDDKSLTANFTIKPYKGAEFYIQPSVAGTAKKSFVDVIAEGKYSRQLTGGVNFSMKMPDASSDFFKKSKFNLHNNLSILRNSYKKTTKQSTINKYTRIIKELKDIFRRSQTYIDSVNKQLLTVSSIPDSSITDLASYNLKLDSLINADLLPLNTKLLSVKNQLNVINSITPSSIELLALRNFMNESDLLQQKAKFAHHALWWISAGVKYNQRNFNVLDSNSATFKRGVRDEFVSLNASVTFLISSSDHGKIYVSPTFTYNNKHNYITDNEIKAFQFKDLVIGSDTVNRIASELAVYPEIPKRIDNFGLDVPVAYYWNKQNIGAQLTLSYNPNDPDKNKYSGKFGIFIPLKTSDGTQIIIEPQARFNKLFQSDLNFFKERFSFGLNLSLAFPKGLFK